MSADIDSSGDMIMRGDSGVEAPNLSRKASNVSRKSVPIPPITAISTSPERMLPDPLSLS